MSLKSRQISHYTLVYDDEESAYRNLVDGEWQIEPAGQIAWLYDDNRQGATVGHWAGGMVYTEALSVDPKVRQEAEGKLRELRGMVKCGR